MQLPLDARPASAPLMAASMRSTLRGGTITVLASALSLASALVPGTALASGYLAARFGSDHGTPVSNSPYAVYYNPAALGGMKGTQIVLDGALVFRSATYERSADALTPSNAAQANDPNYVNANTGKGRLFNVLGLPYLGVASDLGTKNLRVGYAFYVPFGGQAEWRDNKQWAGSTYAPGAVDGPQRWHNISGQILAIYNTAALAYRIESANLTIGANVSVIYHHAKTVRARNFDASDDIRAGNSLKEGRSFLDVSTINMSAALGVYWEPVVDTFRVGLSYTSQPGFGTTRMSGVLQNQFGNIAAQAEQTPVDFLQAYPDIVRLGLSYKPTKTTELRFDADYVRWSVLKNQCVVGAADEAKGIPKANCDVDANGAQPPTGRVVLNIPRDWKDAIGVRAGGAWWPMDPLELFGSVSVTTSAVPKTTIDVSTIDSTRLYLALGARYMVSKNLAVAGSYNPIYFFPVDTVDANGVGQSKHDTYNATSRSPSADGKYSSFIHMINVNGTIMF